MSIQIIASRPSRPGKPASRIPSADLVRVLVRAAFGAALRRKGLTVSALLVSAAAGMVSWNALMAQRVPHPFPMFGARPAVARAVEPATTPIPTSRPRDLPVSEPVATPPRRPVASSDPIGDLLRVPETASIRPADPSRSISAAQKSLVRLGYGPLKTDGVMGQGTRLALERFERDHKLPITGALGPRTSRLLVTKTGAADD